MIFNPYSFSESTCYDITVIDCNTISCNIGLINILQSFEPFVFVSMKLKINRIDCADISTETGKELKTVIERILNTSINVSAVGLKLEPGGKTLVEIFILRKNLTEEGEVERINLSDLLLSHRIVKYYIKGFVRTEEDLKIESKRIKELVLFLDKEGLKYL